MSLLTILLVVLVALFVLGGVGLGDPYRGPGIGLGGILLIILIFLLVARVL